MVLGPTADDVDDKRATSHARRLAGLVHTAVFVPALVAEEVTAVYVGLTRRDRARRLTDPFHPAERYVCIGGIRSTG